MSGWICKWMMIKIDEYTNWQKLNEKKEKKKKYKWIEEWIINKLMTDYYLDY